MDIISAVRAAQESSSMTIRRKCWFDDGTGLELVYLFRYVKRGEPYSGHPKYWQPSEDDILADDWEVVENDTKIPND